ncbi:hypothetical protein BDW42DRAFT_163687 [Aspergillus taichungensis]|uniref:Uncharacterized protein n=1 Tax=Aspergillus taichungensis TaxID=482145 RepID=A0A2J5I200_9EURO|nr:hypothetical protein BDW42DRAFT_163687 [Aspergillus taichungensis]
MVFQISIGDVIALSKLAWGIAQAFSSGRNSAPSEFQEVQNQLSSLTHALDALKTLSSKSGVLENGASGCNIAPILQNCHFTLEHLKDLVNKYMIIEHGDSPDKSEKKRWRDDISKNWKKLRWTREGGDLMRLQHNLGVHLNSLKLTISVLNSEIDRSTSQQVENVHGMLGEIYDWFTKNLKHHGIERDDPSMDERERPGDLTFSLHSRSSGPFDSSTLCDNASFNAEVLGSHDKPVFKCNCQLRRTRYGDVHDEILMQYFISPASLIVRLDGLSQSWKIWLFSGRTSRLTSLIIRDVAQAHLATFEGIVSDLAITMARSAIHRETASLMVSPSINPHTGLPVVSILNMLSDATLLQDKIRNLNLTANGHSYSTGRIEATQLVHYRNLTGDGTWVFNESANIVLLIRLDTHNLTDDEVCEFTINVENDTRVTHGVPLSDVRISAADCCSKTKSGQENMVWHVDADIELTDAHCKRVLQLLRIR